MAVLSDEAERLYREGNEVYFLYCDEIINICAGNPCGNLGLCKTCRLWTKLDFSKLSKGIVFLSMNSYKVENKMPKWEYNNVTELKEVTYKKTHIGLSSLSSYINHTRNLNPLIDDESKIYFDNSLNQGAILVDTIERVVKSIRPDVFVYIMEDWWKHAVFSIMY